MKELSWLLIMLLLALVFTTGCIAIIRTSEAPRIETIEEFSRYLYPCNYFLIQKSDVFPNFVGQCFTIQEDIPKITSEERRILRHLDQSLWKPYTYEEIAENLNLSYKLLNRYISSLRDKGLIKEEIIAGEENLFLVRERFDVSFDIDTELRAGTLPKNLAKMQREENIALYFIKILINSLNYKIEDINGNKILTYDLGNNRGAILCGECKQGDAFLSVVSKNTSLLDILEKGKLKREIPSFDDVCDLAESCIIFKRPLDEPFVDKSELTDPPTVWQFDIPPSRYSLFRGLSEDIEEIRQVRFEIAGGEVRRCDGKTTEHTIGRNEICYLDLSPDTLLLIESSDPIELNSIIVSKIIEKI